MTKIKKRIQKTILVYCLLLIISGATASFPIEGITMICNIDAIPFDFLNNWLQTVALECAKIPNHFIYGLDWLAFAHYAIALNFIGVYRDASRNIWIVDWAILISFLIIPFAFIFGYIRNIPFWWQLIDCSFGVGSIALLYYLRLLIKKTKPYHTNFYLDDEDRNIIRHF